MRSAPLLVTVALFLLLVACKAAPTSVPTPTAALPMPAPAATPTPTRDPEAALQEARLLMLDLINEARAEAGVPPVTLGTNRAAQVHAENLAANCAYGHWGLDGTKPAWRYSLAGGYQVNSENVAGSAWCRATAESVKEQVRRDHTGFLRSKGHRAVVLEPLFKQVNVGIALPRLGGIVVVQLFEGDYVDYQEEPNLKAGVLQLKGRLMRGLQVRVPQDLQVQVWHDPPPKPASAGQVIQTHCVDPGRQVAELEPLPPGRTEIRWKPMQVEHQFCPTPHDFAPDSPLPSTAAEAWRFGNSAKSSGESRAQVVLEVRWIPATTWRTEGAEFAVAADLGEVLEEHGPGVYTVAVWVPVNGEATVVSEWPIFYDINPPDGYGNR